MLSPARGRGLAIVVYAFGASVAFDGLALLLALGLGAVTFALLTGYREPAAMPRYRLEHRRLGRVSVLVATSDEANGRRALQVQSAALTAAGVSDQLVLVEVATGHAVTWQVLGEGTGGEGAAL